MGLPTGTVTFPLADIKSFTRSVPYPGDCPAVVFVTYRRLVRLAAQERGGEEVDTKGDAFFAVPHVKGVLVAVVRAQRSILPKRRAYGATTCLLTSGQTGASVPCVLRF